ncbi:MAG: phytanoyl-CoA dioxygenase family protein, partial [Chlamydiales bacterium]
MTNKEIFEQDGFILFRKLFDPLISQEVAKEWVNFHANPSETLVSKEEPVVVFWSHVPGERKKMRPISEFPSIKSMVNFKPIVDIVRELIDNQTLQILETIIFSKPPLISNRLGWHQDRSYFPFDKDQIAVWTPLDRVTANSGALQYVPRSHNNGLMGSTDLHTGQPFKDEDRKIIPKDPWKLG